MTLIEFKLSITGLDEGTVPVEVKRLKPLNPVGVVGASPRNRYMYFRQKSDTDMKQLKPLSPVGVVGASPRKIFKIQI